MTGCADKTIDLSLARNIRMGGSRQLRFRIDAFNAFNVAIINARNTTVTYNNPVDKAIQTTAVQRGWLLEHGAVDAQDRRFRRGHGRAEHA